MLNLELQTGADGEGQGAFLTLGFQGVRHAECNGTLAGLVLIVVADSHEEVVPRFLLQHDGVVERAGSVGSNAGLADDGADELDVLPRVGVGDADSEFTVRIQVGGPDYVTMRCGRTVR